MTYPCPGKGKQYICLDVGKLRDDGSLDITASLITPTGRVVRSGGVPMVTTMTVQVVAEKPVASPRKSLLDWLSPTRSVSETAGMGPMFDWYDVELEKWAAHHWTTEADHWHGNYYDRALLYYAAWARGGRDDFLDRANKIAVNYRRDYLEANNFGTSAHWWQMEGIATHFKVTGDEASRIAVGAVGDLFTSYADKYMTHEESDGRIVARTLLSFLLALRIGAPRRGPRSPYEWTGDESWESLLERTLTAILGLQGSDGAFRFKIICNEQLNYMTSLLLTSLIKYHDWYKPDPRIKPAVQKALDFLDTQFVATPPSLYYYSGDVECPGVGTPKEPAPDLNGLLVHAYGWAGRFEMGDKLFGGIRNAYLYGSKQFNQSFGESWRYLGYR